MSAYKKFLLLSFTVAFGTSLFAQNIDSIKIVANQSSHIIDNSSFQQPKKWEFITNVPDDLLKIGLSPFEKKNLPGLIFVASSTAILIWQDQHLTDAAKALGRNIHWQPDT